MYFHFGKVCPSLLEKKIAVNLMVNLLYTTVQHCILISYKSYLPYLLIYQCIVHKISLKYNAIIQKRIRFFKTLPYLKLKNSNN